MDAQDSLDEARYLMGEAEPATSSVLISNSQYLNNPRFRDVYGQMGLKRDAGDLPPAYLVPEIQRAFGEVTDEALMERLIGEARQTRPDFAEWLDQRFVSHFDAEELKSYRPGTLGADVCKFIVDSGLEIDFMFRAEARSDLEYLNKRRVQVHDIEHMVTGFDPSPVGEQALMVANMTAVERYFEPELAAELNRFSSFLISTSIMRAGLHYPKLMDSYFEGIARAWALGNRQPRPLFMIRWEDYLDWPIADIRAHFGFDEAPPADYWTWSFAAARG